MDSSSIFARDVPLESFFLPSSSSFFLLAYFHTKDKQTQACVVIKTERRRTESDGWDGEREQRVMKGQAYRSVSLPTVTGNDQVTLT